MTERRATDQFEIRFADRARAYTDAAAARRIDALSIARSAMSARPRAGRVERWMDAIWPRRPIADHRWGALVAIVVISVIAIAVATIVPRADVAKPPTPPPPSAASGPLPEAMQHAWQRPIPETPDAEQWVSGSLDFATDRLEYSVLDGPVSLTDIETSGEDSFVAKATTVTVGCRVGDTGAYRWVLEGKDTVLTLTPIGTDPCAAREKALAGGWVRSDLPPQLGVMLSPGAHDTNAFDPIEGRGSAGRLSYTVPAGWELTGDSPEIFVLTHATLSAPVPADVAVALLVGPHMAADYAKGQACGPVNSDAPGVGRTVDALVDAIRNRPGVVSDPPVAVAIGGYAGQRLDLHIAADWTGGCLGPEGLVRSIPLVYLTIPGSGGGALAGIAPDHPLRLILLDLGKGRTLAISIFAPQSSTQAQFDDLAAQAMQIIEGFEFHSESPSPSQ